MINHDVIIIERVRARSLRQSIQPEKRLIQCCMKSQLLVGKPQLQTGLTTTRLLKKGIEGIKLADELRQQS